MHGLALTLEAVGAALAVLLNLPQTWRSCHRRRVEGLSPASRWLALLQSATWTAYGLTGGGALQVVTNTVCGLLHAGVLLALLRLDPAARAPRLLLPQAVLSATWLGLVAWAGVGGALPVGTLAAGCGTAALVPQLALLVRSRGGAAGVSPLTQWLGVLSNVCWTGYGVLLAGPAVWVPSSLGLLAALTTLALLGRPARDARPVRVTAPCPTGELALAA